MPSTELREHAVKLPSGTTAQRPTGATGLIRHNTTTGLLEFWDSVNNEWVGVGDYYATGGTESTYSDGGVNYKVHTFTSSGTFTVQKGSKNISLLLVAGGGPGGSDNAGGGGAGGLIYVSSLSSITGSYPIVIGAGGTQPADAGGNGPGATNGSNSTGFGYTAIGGGNGGSAGGGDATSGGSAGGV
jgi:hypothetical protein